MAVIKMSEYIQNNMKPKEETFLRLHDEDGGEHDVPLTFFESVAEGLTSLENEVIERIIVREWLSYILGG